MNPVIRVFGKALRLVGISSPEDNLPKAKDATDPPCWRDKTATGASISAGSEK
ncbi:hypothetical protein [Granulicella arctica]|uniref:hypothetical protein n=1 Tax=Granulicella arctica TaxID=940613 RepID=UPI0021E0A0CA|nr:hypothetical protein [Granulicella arctica]